MKRRSERQAIRAKRIRIVAMAVSISFATSSFAAAPTWWSERGVLAPNATDDDYALVNQGQLKNVASAAAAAMDSNLSGGAGNDVHNLVNGWLTPTAQTNDFAPLNLGQLKNTAKPFYDRLIAAGLRSSYPWTGSSNSPDDFAIANIGQVKNLFSFELNILGDGTAPVLTVLSGGDQEGNAGALLPHPIIVQVTSQNGSFLANVPVTFTADEGSFASSPDGDLLSTLTVTTDSTGKATVYFASSSNQGFTSLITASATFNNATASIQVSATSAAAPFRYAIIDLGKDVQPLRVANNGWVLVRRFETDHYEYYRWKAGTLEHLTCDQQNNQFFPLDMNNQGAVVGWLYGDYEVEPAAALYWSSSSTSAEKVSAPNEFRRWDYGPPDYRDEIPFVRYATFSAINDQNQIFGSVYTDGGRFVDRGVFPGQGPEATLNAHRWSTDFTAPTQLSDCAPSNIDRGFYAWSGASDSIVRANAAGHYIGTKSAAAAAHDIGYWVIVPETLTGMVDGHAVPFWPYDINENADVVGSSYDYNQIIVENSDGTQTSINDTYPYPVAINNWTRTFLNIDGTTSDVPTPQVLGYSGASSILWQRTRDGTAYLRFNIDEMIGGADGWELSDLTDISDEGMIVGTGLFAATQSEVHGVLLLPVELKDLKASGDDDDVVIQFRSSDADNSESNIAWIEPTRSQSDKTPRMPQLQIKVKNAPPNLKIRWRMENRYPRRSGQDDLDLPNSDENPYKVLLANQPWEISDEYSDPDVFFGGDCTIFMTLLDSNENPISSEQQFKFRIRGRNPDDGDCKSHIIDNQATVWYAWAVAKHESGDSTGAIYNQFANGLANGGVGAHGAKGEPFHADSEGDGWGLFQRDSNSGYPVTTAETWNWDSNMRGFLETEYPGHLQTANAYVDSVQQANPSTFEEPGFTIEGVPISGRDLLALTLYNGRQGRSNSTLLHFDSTAPSGSRWSTGLPNAPGKDKPYANFIMQEYNDG